MTRRAVLIVGASSGLGRAIYESLDRERFVVYGASRRQCGIEPEHWIELDVRSDESVASAMSLVLQRERERESKVALYAVINCSGVGLAGPAELTSIAEAQEIFETNYFGAVRVCREAVRIMREFGSGIIINVSSLAAHIALPFQSHYSASKAALGAFCEALSLEVESFGIDVVLLEPGDFRSDFTKNRRRCSSDPICSAYSAVFPKAMAIMERSESLGPLPDRIAATISRIFASRRRKTHYCRPLSASERWGHRLRRFGPYALFKVVARRAFGLSIPPKSYQPNACSSH